MGNRDHAGSEASPTLRRMRPGIIAGVLGGILPGICGTIVRSFMPNNHSIDSMFTLLVAGLCYSCTGLFYSLVAGSLGGMVGAFIGTKVSETNGLSIALGLLGGAILSFVLALLIPSPL
jgi:hypothetical protein